MFQGFDAQDAISGLGLHPHPEGGYYAEIYRSPATVRLDDGRVRSASTAIYFLLPEGTFSALHRVSADEVWHHYGGAPLELVTITTDGIVRQTLGPDFRSGQQSCIVVPSGIWQAARPTGAGGTLVGCTVAPGFDFADFEMPDRTTLLGLFPEHQGIILEFTNP